MSLVAAALLAQLAAPLTAVRPTLAFPEPGLDDSAAYAGYRTRLVRDAVGNTVQIYLDARAQRVVHLLADAENESIGFTARGAGGQAAALRWEDDVVRVGRAGRARLVEHALVADEPHVSVGWFLLGSMRLERDLQYAGRQRAPFAEGPYTVAEIEALLAALATLDPAERARHLALLRARDVEELRARSRPALRVVTAGDTVVARVTQPALDAADTLVLELRADPRVVAMEPAGDSLRLRARTGGRVSFRVRIATSGGTLTPLSREQIFAPAFLAFASGVRAEGARAGASSAAAHRARRLERQMRGLELLASREKLMAGLPTYATYFGRDMLMTALMMDAVWRPEMTEFVIASALRKLSTEGRVSHEEALGGQAVREAAAEYAALVRTASALAAGFPRDSALGAARSVLRELRRVRENYHMIDAEFQLPILEARWLGDARVSAARKRAFLLDSSDGSPRIARMLRELALLAELTAPYARDPIPARLVSFAPRDSGRWASQSWRDSEVGYARGRYAMDVNAVWAPRALEAMAQMLDALRGLDLLSARAVRDASPRGDASALAVYARDPGALGAAIRQWRGAERHFVVRLAAAELRGRIGGRLAALPAAERAHWSSVLAATGDDREPLEFLALSLDEAGKPIEVANSDVATRLLLGAGGSGAPDAAERAAVLRDVRTFTRRYPVGLLIERVGPAVANDAYAAPAVWQAFERDRYHGPRVVWGRENNLFLLGATRRLRDASPTRGAEAREIAAYRRELEAAIARVGDAVEASGFHSELWSYELRGGRIVPVRYGSGSDVQLWSTTDLAVAFARRARR